MAHGSAVGDPVDDIRSKAPTKRTYRRAGNYVTATWVPSERALALVLAVAKKRVPSAPMRNAIKRVAREAWRALGASGAFENQTGVIRVHVHALPVMTTTPTFDARGRVGAQWPHRLTTGALKRAVRVDAERVLQQVRRAKS